MTVGLATTVSDPTGSLAGKLDALLPQLRQRLHHISVVITRDTDDVVAERLRSVDSSEDVDPDVWHAGTHRTRAVELALTFRDERVLYADLDHVLRWVERASDEFSSTLTHEPDIDLVVIGRSEAAFAASPERLRRTERIVNDLFRLTTGEHWDMMMAARLMSRTGAEAIVRHSIEASLATDVEWPLLLRRLGFSSGYVAVDGLRYETNPQYGEAVIDRGDLDLSAWIFRLELATRHLSVMREQLH